MAIPVSPNRKPHIAYLRLAVEFDHRLTLMLLWASLREMSDEEVSEMFSFASEWRAQSGMARQDYFRYQAQMPVE